jgi:3-hydroxyisobutyrate dehydrogenase
VTRVGFIGLGAMGAPMARNLASAGSELAVFDVDEGQQRGPGY